MDDKNKVQNKDQSAFSMCMFDATSGASLIEYGLSKREYFAAKAMQGLLSNPNWMPEYKGEKYLMQREVVAEVAIKIADTILNELSHV